MMSRQERNAKNALRRLIRKLRAERFSWVLIEKELLLLKANGMNAWRQAGKTHPVETAEPRGNSRMTPRKERVLRKLLRKFGKIIGTLRDAGYSWRRVEKLLKLQKKHGFCARHIYLIAA